MIDRIEKSKKEISFYVLENYPIVISEIYKNNFPKLEKHQINNNYYDEFEIKSTQREFISKIATKIFYNN